MRPVQLFLIAGILVFISACARDEQRVLPEGNSVRGVLRPAGISLVRRGSHLLFQDGIEHAYIESAQVNLRSYENQLVTLSGSYQLNTNPDDLPVFVAESVADFEETTKEWLFPALDLSLEAPIHWERRSTSGQIHFYLPDNSEPIITFSSRQRPQNEDDVPEGMSIVVDGLPAIRQSSGSGQTVYVLLPDKILEISYQPPADEEIESLRPDWLHLLATINFDRQNRDTATDSSSSDKQGGACGGSAGILCPSGQYCEITDFEDNIGRCRNI